MTEPCSACGGTHCVFVQQQGLRLYWPCGIGATALFHRVAREIAVSQETEADYRREFLNMWLGAIFSELHQSRQLSDKRIAWLLARNPLQRRWHPRQHRIPALVRYPPELCAYPGCCDVVKIRGYCFKHIPDD